MSSAAGRGGLFAGSIAVLMIGVWYLWTNEGKTHNSTLADLVYGDAAFDPYAWWAMHDGHAAAYTHHYPETVAPECQRIPWASEYGTLSVALAGGGDLVDG